MNSPDSALDALVIRFHDTSGRGWRGIVSLGASP